MTDKHTILVVDDEADVVKSVQDLLRYDYKVLGTTRASEGFSLLQQQEVHVVMTDQRMPETTGVDFLHKIRGAYPEAVRLLFTGYADIRAVIDAINQGNVYRYITKPWDPEELTGLIREACERYDLLVERRLLTDTLRQKNAELEAANEELRQASELKSAFIKVASHEMRTPLSILTGLTKLAIRQPGLDSRMLDFLGRIDRSGDRLNRLVDQLTTMLVLGRFDQTLHAPTDLRIVLQQTVEDVRPFAELRRQGIAVELAADLECMDIDAFKIRDSISHLLLNAIKFTPDQGTIGLCARRTANAVEIQVTDSGVGIPATELPQIFRPFFTGFDVSKHSSGQYEFGKKGVGLGLSVVKAFVEMHGGTISVASETGSGAAFTIHLPRETGNLPMPAVRIRASQVEGGLMGLLETPPYLHVRYWDAAVIAATIILIAGVWHLVRVTRRLDKMALTADPAAGGAGIGGAMLQRLAGAGAILLIALGVLVLLVGWTFNIALLKSGFQKTAMNPATACCFIASGAGLLLQLANRKLPARLCALLVSVAGMMKLIDYALGWKGGVDTLLFHNQLEGNVMAPNTALGFVLIGAALAAIDVQTRRGHRPAQFLAVAVGAVALLALIGYAYNTTALYDVASYIPMAVHTAVGFLIMSASILVARPDRGLMHILTSRGMAGLLARLLLPAAILVPFGLGWLRILAERAGIFDSAFDHALMVVLNIGLFLSLIWWSASLLHLAERRLHEINRQLDAVARSQRAAHDALKQAQSHLVQSEKLAGLGQMVAGVAHEINNPLSFVSNNMAVIQRDLAGLRRLLALYQEADTGLASRQPELAARIQESCQRMDLAYTLPNLQDLTERSREGLRRIQQIVMDLRDFARLDESERQIVDLNAGIISTANIISGQARAKNVSIDLQLGALPKVACLPAKINQVVMNLLSNAIDASTAGMTVTVRTHSVTGADRPEVCIEVIDQGGGIDAKIRHRIFDPFFTTKPVGQGTGLGLSISYGIVQEHGGMIEVDSSPGKGTRFVVRLPQT